VLGSLNVDTFLKTDRIPKLGETIGAENDKVFKQFGGKGGNQAIAIARLIDDHKKL